MALEDSKSYKDSQRVRTACSRGTETKYDSSSSSETGAKAVRRRGSREGDEHCLARAIQKHVKELTDNLPFIDSELPDAIVKHVCITEDECKDVRGIRDRKTQIRKVILIVKSRSYNTMENFLDAAKLHCPSIVDDIWNSYNRFMTENRGANKRLCWLCNLKGSVDIKRVVDSLWCAEILDDAVVSEINSSTEVVGRQDRFWESILYEYLKDNRHGQEILCKTLEENDHYSHIARELRTVLRQGNLQLACTCSGMYMLCRRRRTSTLNSESAESEQSVEPNSCAESNHSEEDSSGMEEISDETNDTPTGLNSSEKASAEGFSVLSGTGNETVNHESRNTFDPPRQMPERYRQQRNGNNSVSLWRKFLFFCAQGSLSVPDEEDEEGDWVDK